MSDLEKLDVLWGARSIADFIGKSHRSTFHLLEARLIPARKMGKIWTSTKRELAAALTPANAA